MGLGAEAGRFGELQRRNFRADSGLANPEIGDHFLDVLWTFLVL